jgi:hypothetical protein
VVSSFTFYKQCGRGGLTNHHKGNKRFRDIVALHRPDYVRAPKIQKPSVARVIVRAIRNGEPPGRFLRKDERLGKWVDIGDKKAAEKTSQALREKINEEREASGAKSMLDSPLGGGVLLPSPAAYMAPDSFPTLLTTVPDILPDPAAVVAAVATAGEVAVTEGKTEEADGDEAEKGNEVDEADKVAMEEEDAAVKDENDAAKEVVQTMSV